MMCGSIPHEDVSRHTAFRVVPLGFPAAHPGSVLQLLVWTRDSRHDTSEENVRR